ncbi:AraC family transcriptional regulator [Enterovibrio norvegicus]|uniref:AraC family transcriptional regulator n=1 Tax=Enterovibrio norvegicus TaxID=188144 RepID=UPI000C8314C0|nr:AraC family transcriptional regulator [Enterovibrio norvegicus]PMH60695.1 transcriptional regulator [Enterovibrio norvegicus]TKF28695.1 AraC family transcriptional regulator [Enterovibrio norvegicus]
MKKDKSASFKQSTLLPWVELRVANQSSACYEAHSHDEFSFGIIQQGSANYKNRQSTHAIGKGDVVTINPADVHSCNPNIGTWSYSMLFVDTLKMGDVQRDVLQSDAHDYTPFIHDFERNPDIQQRFSALFEALKSDASVLHAQVCFYDFIEGILGKQQQDSLRVMMSQPPLVRIRERLLDDIEHTHQLDELAQEAGMSRYQLLRAFKHQFGLPPHAYLMDEKIKRAKIMLKSGDDISDVALKLGFSDQAHFQRQFKKKLAVTPKFYQSHFVIK